jgi:hypothetical protein
MVAVILQSLHDAVTKLSANHRPAGIRIMWIARSQEQKWLENSKKLGSIGEY